MPHSCYSIKTTQESAFTLIELSIVLVIIGLIVGGILTGQELINAATIRAQITQIERYNTATRAFRAKYGYMPGDIPDPQASSFGFKGRGGGAAGTGDGNGIVQGYFAGVVGTQQTAGETALFWEDLGMAGLIDSNPSTATATGVSFANITLSQYFPTAKIGNGNYVYVYEDGWYNGASWQPTGVNYYGISAIASVNCSTGVVSNTGLSVLQAYNIDKKVDDGLPQSGVVEAFHLNIPASIAQSPLWAAGGGLPGAGAPGNTGNAPTTAATNYATTNCFDNNGVVGTQLYSVAKNAAALNCALSFRFQ